MCLLPGLALLLSLGTADAQHRGNRARAIESVLIDLARMEIFNVQRTDPRVEQQVQGEIGQIREQLLHAIDGDVHIFRALRHTQRALRTIRGLNASSRFEDSNIPQRFDGLIGRMEGRVQEIMGRRDAFWGRWDQGGPPGPPPAGPAVPPPAPVVRPMHPAAFNQFLGQLRGASFDDQKLGLIRDTVGAGNHFTCAQIVQMMRTSAFGNTQVEIAARAFPVAVDPQNFSQLTSALRFEGDRRRLRQRLGR